MSTGVGGRIAQAMQRQRLSARQVEERLAARGGEYINRVTLGLYIREQRSPTARLLLELAQVLGVRPEWLLTGEGDPPASANQPDEFPWLPDGLRSQLARTAGIVGSFRDQPAAVLERTVAEFTEQTLLGALRLTNTSKLLASDDQAQRLLVSLRSFEDIQTGIALLLMATERVAGVVDDNEKWLAVKPVRGRSVATGHTKTGKGRKQPKSRKP